MIYHNVNNDYLKVFQVIINVSLLEHCSHPEPLFGSRGALNIVIIPVLASCHPLLGAVVLDTLHCLQLKICTNSSLENETSDVRVKSHSHLDLPEMT